MRFDLNNARLPRREFLEVSAALLLIRPMPQITTLLGMLNNPFHVVIGPDGRLYFSDYGTNRVLAMDLRTKMTSVIAGTGTKGYSGDGGPATKAQLAAPHEVRFDSKGNMYVDERDNHIIRKIDM